MSALAPACGNHLLEALRTDEYLRLLPDLEPVALARGQVLEQPGCGARHAYFPTSAIVSLVCTMKNGASAEIALTGCDGLVGVSLFMGGDGSTSSAIVQVPGQGLRIAAGVLKSEFALGRALQALALRYTLALMVQIGQTAVCNRHHKLDQQLCRRLLLGLDRMGGDELCMTQKAIAGILGVRREGVTTAARKLQADGLIRWSRGRIEVLDRPRLEQRACECYGSARSPKPAVAAGTGRSPCLGHGLRRPDRPR